MAPLEFAFAEDDVPLSTLCGVLTRIVRLPVPSPRMFFVFPELPSTIFILDLLLGEKRIYRGKKSNIFFKSSLVME